MQIRKLGVGGLVVLAVIVAVLAGSWAVAFFYGRVEHPLAEWLPQYVAAPSAPPGGLVVYFVSGFACILMVAVLLIEMVLMGIKDLLRPVAVAPAEDADFREFAGLGCAGGGVGIVELPKDASDKLIVGLVRFALADGQREFKVVVRASTPAGGAPLTLH